MYHVISKYTGKGFDTIPTNEKKNLIPTISMVDGRYIEAFASAF